jgi:hypothetical protein
LHQNFYAADLRELGPLVRSDLTKEFPFYLFVFSKKYKPCIINEESDYIINTENSLLISNGTLFIMTIIENVYHTYTNVFLRRTSGEWINS